MSIVFALVLMLATQSSGATTNYALEAAGITSAGLSRTQEGVNGGHAYVSWRAGGEIRVAATGTDLTLTALSDGGATPVSVSVDGGAFSEPTIGAGWVDVPLFTGLSDAAHAVIVKYSTLFYVDIATTLKLTGATPSLAYSTGYAKAYLLRDVLSYLSVEPVWKRGNDGFNTPGANVGSAMNDASISFRATCSAIKIYHYRQGYKYELVIDGARQSALVTTTADGVYGWDTLFSGLDSAAEHLYRVRPVLATNFQIIPNVMTTGGTGINEVTALANRFSIFWVGDSITRTHGSDPSNPDTRTGIASLVGQALNFAAASTGVAGAATPSSMTIEGQKPDVIELGWGTNDIRTGVSVADFKAKAVTLLASARTEAPLAKIVWRAILQQEDAGFAAQTASFNAAIQEAIAENGDPNMFYKDFSAGFDPTNDAHATDGLHPTAAGYAIIAANEIAYYGPATRGIRVLGGFGLSGGTQLGAPGLSN